MSITRTIGRVGATAAVLALAPAIVVQAGHDRGRNDVELTGRAVLPVFTYADGPPAGAFVTPNPQNGVQFPLPSQPVEGFSGIVEGRHRGEYLAMPDNGFGAKANSSDFLIRAYYVEPDFKTKRGGSGEVDVGVEKGEFISFRDPYGVFGFPIVNDGTEERLLTGADIDPESIQRGRHGDLWVGDEFGPWILHFDSEGVLLERPIALPDNLVSVNHPDVLKGNLTATVNNSRGIEAMAISPNERWLTVVLEGAVIEDNATNPTSRRIYQYNVKEGTFTRLADYHVEVAGHFVSDVQALDNRRMLVVERDGGRGVTALFRKVYRVDLQRTGPNGGVAKTEVVDLAAIPDPDGVSLPAIHEGDVGLGNPFRVTCESIEALHVIGNDRLLLGCDNNFPNSGRNPTMPDDNEFIVVKTRL